MANGLVGIVVAAGMTLSQPSSQMHTSNAELYPAQLAQDNLCRYERGPQLVPEPILDPNPDFMYEPDRLKAFWGAMYLGSFNTNSVDESADKTVLNKWIQTVVITGSVNPPEGKVYCVTAVKPHAGVHHYEATLLDGSKADVIDYNTIENDIDFRIVLPKGKSVATVHTKSDSLHLGNYIEAVEIMEKGIERYINYLDLNNRI